MRQINAKQIAERAVPSVPQPIQPGHLYLPHANRHLILRSGCVGTAMGPTESRCRPSADTLFAPQPGLPATKSLPSSSPGPSMTGRQVPLPSRPVSRPTYTNKPGHEPDHLPDASATTNPCGPLFEPIEQDVEPKGYTCPECGGALAAVEKGSSTNFRCHVGHTFSPPKPLRRPRG
jgi:two-component system chemotaxis response regulator CheB